MKYDYRCVSCGWFGELNVPVEERNEQICECGEDLLKDVIVPPVHFRADGFVTTEERKLKRKIEDGTLHPIKDRDTKKKRDAALKQIQKENPKIQDV